jgi:hypothetical protein
MEARARCRIHTKTMYGPTSNIKTPKSRRPWEEGLRYLALEWPMKGIAVVPATLLLALLFAQASRTALPGPSSPAVELRAALQQRAPNYDVTASNFVDALIEVAGTFKLPMGVVWIRKPAELKPVKFSWSDTTVDKMIHDIVNAQPGYGIEVRNAVVHVRPRQMIPSTQSFLGLKIASFEAQNEVAELADKRLAALANIRVMPPKPPPAGQAGAGVGLEQAVEMGDPEISISLADVSVEDVLDAISLASPFKVWLVTFEGDNNLTPGGFRRTVLASGRSVPDEDQPLWEILKWGRMPY